MAINTALALEDTQIAVMTYLRGAIGEMKVGDHFPQDQDLEEYVLLKEVRTSNISIKQNKRLKLSFTFHVFSKVTKNFLEMMDKVQSLEDAQLVLEKHNVDDIKLNTTHTFVQTNVEKHVRNGVVIIDIFVSEKIKLE